VTEEKRIPGVPEPDIAAAERGRLSDEDDRTLVARAGGDPAAFGALYERYVDRIYNYIYHRVGNQCEAEDLTARTFQRALHHVGRYTDRGAPFSAWLYRIAHNLVANWYRDRSRCKTIPLDDLSLASHKHDDPYRQALRSEQIDEVRHAVRELSQDRQTLLVLKHSEHLSNAEIAAVLGKTEGAIKSLYHRTLIALRHLLEDQGLDIG
jgi:RNA polymerase sigma-70 factor (ECF subfamily)